MTPDGVGGVLRPNHMAIIMDGNGRWAARSGKGRHLGHRAGVKAARTVVEAVAEAKVKILTLFAFSSENFNRPPAEVDALMRLFIEVLQREVDALHRNGIQVRFIGNREALPNLLRKRMVDAEARTASNSRMTLVLALAYGGQWDMVQAMRRIGQKVRAGELEPTEIDEGTLNRHRALAGLPPPDMLIRTGGEHRISNFLLWDLAYTEFCFSDTLWPDFGAEDVTKSLQEFSQRQRRFGYTDQQLEARAD